MNRFLLFFIASIILCVIGLVLLFYPTDTPSVSHFKKNSFPQKHIELNFISSRNQVGEHSFYDLAFLNNNDVLAVDYFNGILTSNDGGNKWQLLPPSVGVVGGVQNVDFVNSQKGWAAGTILVSTKDGGKSWHETKLPIFIHSMYVDFMNEQIGYVAGDIGYYDRDTDKRYWGIAVFKTSDGGETWNECYSNNKPLNVFQVKVLDENVAFVVSNGEILFRTEDGGKTWKEVYTESNGTFSLAFAPDGTGWLVGFKGNFLKSSDKGKTWKEPDNIPQSFSKHNWWSIDLTKEGIGVAVSEDSAIALTKDGGKTWVDAEFSRKFSNTSDVYPIKEAYNDSLRAVRLYGNTGFIIGSQNVYKISFPD